MRRTLLVPGIDGSPQPHWQYWWAGIDPSSLIVDQEDWAKPCPADWVGKVARVALDLPGSILVAHSLGCLVVARLAEVAPDLDVAGAILVAPPDPARCARLADFADVPRNPLPFPAIVVASRNDPWMPIDGARNLADDWEARFVDLGFAGHVNAASGFGPWPEGVRMRDELARANRRAAGSGAFAKSPRAEARP